MKKNMGSLDRLLRVVIALTIAVLFFTEVITGVLGIVLLIVAGILLLTSMIGFCPLYAPFRFSSRKAQKT